MDEWKGYEIKRESYWFYFLATSPEEAKQLLIEQYGTKDEHVTENVGKFEYMKELEDDDIMYSGSQEPFSVAKVKIRESSSFMFGYID